MRKKLHLSWKRYSNYVDEVAKSILREDNVYSDIYGIPRGGLIPAVMLSHILNIRVITDVGEISEKTLICDDINDSGKTLEDFLDLFNFSLDVAVIINNDHSSFLPKYIGFENKKCLWISFPYESENDTISEVLNV